MFRQIHVINLDDTVGRYSLFCERNSPLRGAKRLSATGGGVSDRGKLTAEGVIREDPRLFAWSSWMYALARASKRRWQLAALRSTGCSIHEGSSPPLQPQGLRPEMHHSATQGGRRC
jgi:hypothetical protein